MAVNVFELFAKVGIDSSEVQSGLDNVLTMCTNGFKKIAGLGIGAFTNIAKSSVQVGMSFDTAMSQVAATMGLTTEDMKDQVGEVETAYGHFEGNLRDFAKFMGSNTKFSATQAAEALNYMALAGYNVNESMEMMPNVMNLAAAGGLDLAYASDMLTDTQKALGIDFERTNKLVDEFAKAASTGNTSVGQLGEAFLTVGGLANEMNGGMITLSDGSQAYLDNIQMLEVAFTALADRGIKGSEAGTHMRNMLLKLASPTKEAKDLFDKFGISLYDDTGQMKAMNDIFSDLNRALGSMTQADKLQAISDIFNARDTASAEALLGAITGADWDRIGEAILNADDAAEKMALTQEDNLQGAMTSLKSAAEGFKIELSEVIFPLLTDIVKFGTGAVRGLTGMLQSDAFRTFKENFIKITDIYAQKFGKIIASAADNLPKILSKFSWIKDDAKQIFGTFSDLIGKINFKGLLDSAESIIEPLSKYWEKLGDGVSWLSENVISPVIEWGMNDALPKVFEGVAASFDVLRGAIEFLKTPAKAIWEEFLQPLGSIAGDVIEGSLDLISKGLNGIADAVEGVDWEGYWFDIFEGKFGEDWALGWDEIKNNIEDAGDSIEEFFDTPDEEGWGKKWRTFWEDAGGAVYDFKSHIDKEIENTTEILGKFFDGVKKAKSDGAGFIEYMGDVIEGRDYKINSTYPYASDEYWEEMYGIDGSKLQKQQVIENRQKSRMEAAKEAGRAEAEAKRIEAAKQAGKLEANAGSMVGSVLNALSGFRKMARGGVIVGEAGAEAVVPLENNTQWTSKVADEFVNRISGRLAGSSGMVVQNLTINMQGMEISSDYGTQRFIEKLSEQLKVYQNTQIRGVGGVGY